MNTNNEKYYAILMNKLIIDDDEFLYKPVTLIEGIPETNDYGKIFTDELDTIYMDINNVENADCTYDFCVAYIISEKDLIKKYDCSDVSICKQRYLDEILSVTHFGIYDEEKSIIQTFVMDLRKIKNSIKSLQDSSSSNKNSKENLLFVCILKNKYEELLEMKTYDELHSALEQFYKENLESDGYSKKINNGEAAIVIQINKFKELLDIKTYDDLLSKLKEMYNSIMNIENDIEKETEELLKDKELSRNEKNLESEEPSKTEESLESETLNVKKLKQYLDNRIIGQEEAKKDAILTVFNNTMVDSKDRSSCLFVGPTGSGKTLITETICEYLNIPFEIIDVTQLSMPGYKGSNIEDFLQRLIAKTGGDVAKAEKAIVVLDELDKKGTDDNSDISGKGVLNTLLPFLQGTTYNIEYGHRMLHFDTSKLTVFATGAFTDVAKEKSEKSYSGSGMGFARVNVDSKEDIKYEKLSIEDLAKYGNIPIELLGRFTVITQLSGHTKESLISILLNSELSPLQKKSKKLAKLGIELQWTEGYINSVVENAIKLKTGARSLKSVIERSMKYVEYEVIEEIGKYKKIILTENSVIDNENVELVDINNNIINLKDIILSKTEEVKRMSLRIGGNL